MCKSPSDPALQVEQAIAQAVEQHGKIDSVANCVGSIVLKSAHTTTDAEFDQVGGAYRRSGDIRCGGGKGE